MCNKYCHLHIKQRQISQHETEIQKFYQRSYVVI